MLQGTSFIATVAFYGDDGQLLGLIEDAEGVCSKALNRLAQTKDNPE